MAYSFSKRGIDSDQNFPKLEYSSPNLTNRPTTTNGLIEKSSSLPYLSLPDLVKPMDDPMKLARSVVAGCLVHKHDTSGFITPIATDFLVYYLKEDYLISAIEKEALLEVGKRECEGEKDIKEVMILGLNHVVVSIGKDTGSISYEVIHWHGVEKARVLVWDIERNRLSQEMLPRPPLLLQDLAVSAEDILEEERNEQLRIAVLKEPCNWCPPPRKPLPVTVPVPVTTGARISRRFRRVRRIRPRVKQVESILESMRVASLAEQRYHGDVNDPFSKQAAARRLRPKLHMPASSELPEVSTAPQTSSSSSAPSLTATSMSTPTAAPFASGSSLGNSSVLH